MKSIVRIRSPSPSPSPSSSPSFYKYLKPGALAKLRYSKITARSKQIGAQTLLALCQLQLDTNSSLSQQQHSMDRIPCFNLRVSNYTRCLQRRKFVATRPFFSETEI